MRNVLICFAFQAYTIPEYLKLRFGGKRIRTLTSVILLLQYILRNISVGSFIRHITDIRCYICRTLQYMKNINIMIKADKYKFNCILWLLRVLYNLPVCIKH